MSQSDSFIEEVTEEVRRDRLFAMFRRYGWIAALAVVLIVGGAAWNEYRKAGERAAAQAFGDGILTALEAQDPAARVEGLSEIATTTADHRALRGFLQAAEAAEADDTAGAIAALEAVSNDAEVPLIYRSLAVFRKLALQAESVSPAERRAGYEGLTAPGAPLRLLAKEQIALTHVEEGNVDQALALLDEMQNDAEMTPDLRQRTSQLIVSLGGSLESDAN